MDFGRFNPFNWHTAKKDINTDVVYKFPTTGVTFIVSKTIVSIKRVLITDESETTPTTTALSWDINGITLNATKISTGLTAGNRYYFKMVIGSTTYYSDIIEGAGADCFETLSIGNSCNNSIFPFADSPSIINVHLPEIQWDTPEVSAEYETIYTETGESRKLVRQITKHTIYFVAPKWYKAMLDGAITCDISYLSSGTIKNMTLEVSPIGDTLYSEYRLIFEYDTLQEGNDCCEEVNLDDIDSPGGGSGGICDDFYIEIDNTADLLTVNLFNEPSGKPTYRWYRNGVLISTASSINIIQSGDYRVDVNDSGCRATASYYKDDVCGLFSVDVYASGNYVNADLSNVPDGCTPTYSVILEGTEIATSVPFEVAETGVYFVKVTACDCVKSGGVYIAFSADTNCDFTIDIDQTGTLLEADTNASTPDYLWEYEDSTGRTNVGTGSSITAQEKGIYWLTITSGGCSKETYLYLAPSSQTGVVVLYRANGYQFDIPGINLSEIVTPANDLLVTINGTLHTYTTDSTPDSANLYSIVGGQLVTRSASPFTNATIVVKVL